MKKLFLFLIIFNYSMSIEPFLDVVSDYRLQNYNENYLYYKTIAGAKHSGRFYYTEFSIIAEESQKKDIDLYRGYTELYYRDYSILVGRQAINWGTAYTFNLADIFNSENIIDPKAERRGIDSLYLKYSSPNMSRTEFVYFRTNDHYDRFATRYTFLVDSFEFMANYFSVYQTSPKTRKMEHNNKVVLEVKGDIGIGIWSQLGYDNLESKDLVTGVVGADYNFDLFDHSIYTVAETEYNEYITGLLLSYRFSLTEDITFSQAFTTLNKDWFISNIVTYTYNDYLEFQGLYNYFSYDKMPKFYTHYKKKGLDTEITLRIKLYL